ncbi:hypothetical protein GbCGDNIH6_8215 [Granulibacter bethesdensis]|nr:hypothetical protein GbCGDNIH6_8215 [Granulibacter bethesdensis]
MRGVCSRGGFLSTSDAISGDQLESGSMDKDEQRSMRGIAILIITMMCSSGITEVIDFLKDLSR